VSLKRSIRRHILDDALKILPDLPTHVDAYAVLNWSGGGLHNAQWTGSRRPNTLLHSILEHGHGPFGWTMPISRGFGALSAGAISYMVP